MAKEVQIWRRSRFLMGAPDGSQDRHDQFADWDTRKKQIKDTYFFDDRVLEDGEPTKIDPVIELFVRESLSQ